LKKKALLLSGLGGSLFPYLHQCLTLKYDLYYLDSDKNLEYLYPDLNFFPAPLVTTESYWELVQDIITKKEIDFYIPLIDEELISANARIAPLGLAKVITPTIEFCKLSLNKFHLMLELEKFGISFIRSYRAESFHWQIGPPIFVKPVSGRGSRGIRKITSQSQLDAYYLLENYRAEEVLIQEHVSGVEYTIGVTINPANQILELSVKRIIKKRGITQIAVTERNDLIKQTVREVVQKLKPGGPINIQLFVTEANEVKIFEINPRFSTTTIMSYAAGIDVISLCIDYFSGSFSGEIFEPKSGITLHRRWENLFYEK
jgi:carbamoyl-phosphate synthase large subunit